MENGKAKCLNRSMKKEAIDKYYKDDYVFVTKEMMIEGEVKPIIRNAKKLLIEAQLQLKKKKSNILESKFSEYLDDKDF